ncbi:MAG TPA: DUF502 domain-containing protein [Holophagaceae bacterium]|nr:DUF502 domain-containing protein [Holophagaceae bacterium]
MIRRTLFAGIFTLLPLVVTIWVLKAIFSTLVGISQQPMRWGFQHLGLAEPPYWVLALTSLLGLLVLLMLVGVLVGNLVGRQLLVWMDDLMVHVPLVKGIYGATKQLMGAIQSGQGGSFKEVVLVEWPHEGAFTLGFVARRDCSWAIPGGESMVAVYVPTAPNPTSGYVIMVDQKRIRPVDLSPDQALTWAVSGGVVAPIRTHTGSFRIEDPQ